MNHLSNETSPYLRQHQDNPVAWYPWGDEAFAQAVALDRPLFISIGYSACHWCHVMAHESFEDEKTAAVLNDQFIAIKVDREERPDIDAIYMEAVQALSGHGGWPLSVFATPDGRPFFGGTYFPKGDHHNTPSFTTVLQAVDQAWREQRDDLNKQASALTATVASRLETPPSKDQTRRAANALLADAITRFSEMFDRENGGIGNAPKFPQTPMLELMVRAHLRGNKEALSMVETALSAMASGGIYDHLGGGFCRYSVDARWQVPHFEKMLYDQAGLARLYLHVWQLTGDERWRQVLDETLSYVLRDLSGSTGGICSSEDADSEGEEGRFYVWTKDEFVELLGTSLGNQAASWYGVSDEGNFEGKRNVLHLSAIGELVRPKDVEDARAQLLKARGRRVRPGRDDKVLTEWNAMIGSVFCEAAGATGNEVYKQAAEHIGTFLSDNLRQENGRWLRSYQDGRSAHLAVASDYAWLVDFFTRLSECTGRAHWLDEAIVVARQLIELFSAENGGFYTTGSDASALIVRPRDTYDGVTPAANSVAASALLRLGALTGDNDFTGAARSAINAGGAALDQSPIAFSHLVSAALDLDDGPIEIAVVGDRPDLVEQLQHRYLPGSVLAWGDPRPGPLWDDRSPGLAYVCRWGECLAPVNSPEALVQALEQIENRS